MDRHADVVADKRLTGLSVLLVEDDPDFLEVAREMLERAGALVIEARDGDEALARFQSHDVDVIVSDLALPGLDGLDTIRRIRSSEDARTRTPAIAVSGLTQPEDLRAAIAAGFDGHASKPPVWEELVSRVAHLARWPLLQHHA